MCYFLAMLSSTVLWHLPPQVQHFRVYNVYSHPLSHLVFTTTLGCQYLAFASGGKQAHRTDKVQCSGHDSHSCLWNLGPVTYYRTGRIQTASHELSLLALTWGLGPLGSKGVGSVSGGMGGPGRVRGKGSRTRSCSPWFQDFYQLTLFC